MIWIKDFKERPACLLRVFSPHRNCQRIVFMGGNSDIKSAMDNDGSKSYGGHHINK